MCAKLSKKAIVSFKEGMQSIFSSHGVEPTPELIDSLEQYFFEVYKPKKTTPPYWSALVANYLSFYQEITGEKASFIPAQASALSKLDKILMNRYLSAVKDSIWDEATATRQHLIFYNEAIKIDFYKRSFNIALLYNNFDMIKSQLSDLRAKQIKEEKNILGI